VCAERDRHRALEREGAKGRAVERLLCSRSRCFSRQDDDAGSPSISDPSTGHDIHGLYSI